MAYDAGNAVLRAWRVERRPSSSRSGAATGFAHAGHLILYPDTREIVVLAAVGDTVASAVRDSDFVAAATAARSSCALLPSTGREGAVEVAEKLRGAISRVAVAGVSRKVSASFGVAVIPDDAGEPEQALRAADRALYTAKGDGRDRVETASRARVAARRPPRARGR